MVGGFNPIQIVIYLSSITLQNRTQSSTSRENQQDLEANHTFLLLNMCTPLSLPYFLLYDKRIEAGTRRIDYRRRRRTEIRVSMVCTQRESRESRDIRVRFKVRVRV